MSNDTLVTLGRSDAILAADIVELYIQESKDIMPKEDIEEAENLLQFIKVQLDSIANR